MDDIDLERTKTLKTKFDVTCLNCNSKDVVISVEYTRYETIFHLTCSNCKHYTDLGHVSNDVYED